VAAPGGGTIDAPALLAAGQAAFHRGDLAGARDTFRQLAALEGTGAQPWIQLAVACQGLGDAIGEEEAIRGALKRDPTDLVALILSATLLERQDKRHQAANAYGAALAVAPPLDRLHPDLRAALAKAKAYRQRYDADFSAHLDEVLAPHFRDARAADVARFRESIDIMVGRKRRHESQPTHYFVPGLVPIAFFPRERFSWLDAFESATDAIEAEFKAVAAADSGIAPYISYPEGVPLNQWAELNHSRRWSAIHLIEKGRKNEDHAARCPETMALLAAAPQPVQPGRTPGAMFSLLAPATRIPAHTGVSNARLVVHLPLVVPPGCGFRVGNETHEWVRGRGWVFDDTIEHEAWNDSGQLRVVLIFDIWHPDLTAPEREMITAMAGAIDSFVGDAASFGL